MDTFHSHGKFLLSGEYLILHGAQGLTLPLTRMKQSMQVQKLSSSDLSWEAFDENNQRWLTLDDSKLLQKILIFIKERKPHLFDSGLAFSTRMNFSRHWGMGSSSTLIANLAQWSGISAMELQQQFFGGSGYDVAAATETKPFVYRLHDKRPVVETVAWDPVYKKNLRFVYLGKKMNSREAIESFKQKFPIPLPQHLKTMNALTQKFLQDKTLADFTQTIFEHERFIGSLLEVKSIKEQLFSDFNGAVKSLGGWGGDFVLAASEEDSKNYFIQKGFSLSFIWDELI